MKATERDIQPLPADIDRSLSLSETLGDIYDKMPTQDKIALLTAPIPIVGDIAGGIADVMAIKEDPSATNIGLALAGLLPFVPSGGVTKAGLKAAAGQALPQIPNYLRYFYSGNPVAKTYGIGEGGAKGLANIIEARYSPKARAAYLEAFDSGDKDKALAAQEALTEAKSELKSIQNWKTRLERQVKQKEQEQPQQQVQQPQQQTQAVDPKAQEWAEENEWFGKDTIKTAAALALDAELKNEGYDPNDDEFYEEIDKRLETAFGQTSQRVQDNTKEPAQVVSGSSRSSPTSSKKVKLSKEDVRLANKWGIPLEQYAAEKMKVTQADGEYTNIT
jgi:hypothetical protein